MSNFLAIDTSSRYLTVLAAKGERTVVRHLPDCAMRHSVILMDEIDGALKEIGLTPADCDFFAAVTGPGSFTGIRIGVATAKGFALATGKKLCAVTSFDLLAYNVADESVTAVIDAAHDHCYVCGYGKNREITLPPCYMTFDEVRALNAPLVGFEDLPFAGYRKLDVKDCLLPAVRAKSGELSDAMCALYVRRSQAEEARACR